MKLLIIEAPRDKHEKLVLPKDVIDEIEKTLQEKLKKIGVTCVISPFKVSQVIDI